MRPEKILMYCISSAHCPFTIVVETAKVKTAIVVRRDVHPEIVTSVDASHNHPLSSLDPKVRSKLEKVIKGAKERMVRLNARKERRAGDQEGAASEDVQDDSARHLRGRKVVAVAQPEPGSKVCIMLFRVSRVRNILTFASC